MLLECESTKHLVQVEVINKMDSSRPSSIGSDDYENVCKHGFFRKSPPIHLFTNQTSWKKRHFTLSKSIKNGYILRYFKDQQLKGNIEINETSKIEIGIADSEKMAMVRKMFKCVPTEVMTIRTGNRDFYLIGTDSKEVEEWANILYETCREKEVEVTSKMDYPRKSSIENYHCEEVCKPISFKRSPPVRTTLELRTRSKSSPACLDEKDEQCHGNQYEELPTTAFKKRPTSEPIHQVPSEEDHIYESPRKIMQRLRRLTHGPLDEQSGEDYEKENDYASPRSIQAQLTETNPECSSSDEEQSNDDGGYISMKDICPLMAEEDFQPTSAGTTLPTIPPVKENSVNPQVAQDSPLKPTPLPRKAKPGKMPKISFLSVVQLSIILSKITKDNQMQEVDLLFPQSDFINCVTLTEASGHVCVSQWSDPHHLGCLFHQGDYIVAVNDMHVKNIDEISLFTSRSRRKEVKLTVHRLPNSEILHATGCKCP
ncbi:pleckstrin homology domain-containing family S member 1 [Anolis sagrei]|uniref:pleckstrin homology domain-containing family S member 1 n=1 Tax=Anolis sagrei TaxID=38937 RepID=UPI003521A544